MTDTEIIITVTITTLTILVFIGLLAVLLVTNRNRRVKHRAEVAEMHARHVEEVRLVEKEVLRSTLAEVGHELHDNIAQKLYGIRLGLMNAVLQSGKLPQGDLLIEAVQEATNEVRRLSYTIHPDHLDRLDLAEAAARECDRMQRVTGVPIKLDRSGEGSTITSDQKMVLFRIMQEAMGNALKHAEASNISVAIAENGHVRMVVADDGKGFAPSTDGGTNGQGLLNMKRRAELIGYRCAVESTPGNGTVVTVAP